MDRTFVRSRAFYVFSALVLAVVFLYYTHPIKLGDIWWHLSNGRWIVQNWSIPTEDPFAFTTTAEPSRRTQLVLGGFWLAQVLYYIIYSLGGFEGLIYFEALLLTLAVFTLWKTLLRAGNGGLTSWAIVLPLVFLTNRFVEVRPQTFSFLLVLLLYNEAEGVLGELQKGMPLRRRRIAAGLLIMALWANLHRGFMIGQGVLGVYALAEAVSYLFKRSTLGRDGLAGFLKWVGVSLFGSLLSPNHVNAVMENIWELTAKGSSIRAIEEYMPPWDYSAFFGIPYTLYGLGLLAALTLGVLAISIGRLRLRHGLLYLGFLAAGLGSFRFCIFFILMSVAVSAGYIEALSRRIRKGLGASAAVVAPLCVMLLLINAYRHTFIGKDLIDKSFLPEDAVSFMAANGMPQQIFNPYEWGGYISWRLYPGYKVFVDSRTIDQEAHEEYRKAKHGAISGVFRQYGIRSVIFYPVNPIINEVPGVIFSLLRDAEWNLVYMDPVSVIFKTAGAEPELPAMRKSILWEELLRRFEGASRLEPSNVNHIVQLGVIYYARGDSKQALEYLNRALSMDSDNKKALAWIEKLRLESAGG